MKFTGTLIEDLIATVERAERTAQSNLALSGEPLTAESIFVEPLLVEPLFVEPLPGRSLVDEPWFASVQQARDYDSKLIGVA